MPREAPPGHGLGPSPPPERARSWQAGGATARPSRATSAGPRPGFTPPECAPVCVRVYASAQMCVRASFVPACKSVYVRVCSVARANVGVCVRLCVSARVCLRVCECARACVGVCADICASVYACMRARMGVHECERVYGSMCVGAYLSVCVCVCDGSGRRQPAVRALDMLCAPSPRVRTCAREGAWSARAKVCARVCTPGCLGACACAAPRRRRLLTSSSPCRLSSRRAGGRVPCRLGPLALAVQSQDTAEDCTARAGGAARRGGAGREASARVPERCAALPAPGPSL